MTVLNRVRSLFSRSQKVVSAAVSPEPSGIMYSVIIPGEEAVMVRAQNKNEARAFVREARSLNRLPAGTVINRV